jgi:hypothetical protein
MSKVDKLAAGLAWWASHVKDKGAVEAWLVGLCANIQVKGGYIGAAVGGEGRGVPFHTWQLGCGGAGEKG